MNNLTSQDIKNSIEVKWIMFYIKYLFIMLLIITILSLIIYLITIYVGVKDIDVAPYIFMAWGMLVGIIFIKFGLISLYIYAKIRYLYKNYKTFKEYKVMLNTFSTSYQYRGTVYYIVEITDENLNKINVKTNHIFSDLFISKFKIVDYNNKEVIGLYDSNKKKFYLIKKA